MKRIYRCTVCDKEECTYVDKSNDHNPPNHCVFRDGDQCRWVEVTNVKKKIRELEELGYVIMKRRD